MFTSLTMRQMNIYIGLEETYLGKLAKEKKQRVVTMLECDGNDARPQTKRWSDGEHTASRQMENKESKKAQMEKKTERRTRQREGDETYLGMVAKEKKQRLVTMLECDKHDAQMHTGTVSLDGDQKKKTARKLRWRRRHRVPASQGSPYFLKYNFNIGF